MSKSELPYKKKPCNNCPFRKDSLPGWLGEERMREILSTKSFVCHKNTNYQCAGHMIINGEQNDFVKLAARLNVSLNLSGEELVFNDHNHCIEHHKH
jgi:hypothetical protein